MESGQEEKLVRESNWCAKREDLFSSRRFSVLFFLFWDDDEGTASEREECPFPLVLNLTFLFKYEKKIVFLTFPFLCNHILFFCTMR